MPSLHQSREWLAARWAAITAWSAPARKQIARAPWPKIGVWAGGGLGVVCVSFALFLAFADWNAFKDPIARMASAATGRDIVIRGDLDVRPFSLTPEVSISGLSIGNPVRTRARGAFAEVAQAEASVRLLPLFIGRVEFVRLDLAGADLALYRDAEGVSNWSGDSGGRAFNMPAIRSFALRDGRLRYQDDKRRVRLNATFETEESSAPGARSSFTLAGEGALNDRPFTLAFSGAPLINVRRDQPYAFEADIRAGATHVEAAGAIARPFDFNRWNADINAAGADLADLYELIGLALPNTPPYRVRGRLERQGARFGMPQLAGRVGDSDIAGNWMATRQRSGRMMFAGDFRSRDLDFDDLAAVLGAPPSTDRGETASAEQHQTAAALEAQGRLLPDSTLDISRVRNMDARVSFHATRVRSETLPLSGLSFDLALDEGLLRIDPMVLQLTRGRVAGAASINAREETPQVELDVRLADARVENIITLASGQPITGPLAGRARLIGRGASVREAAANANGEVTLVIPSGEIREAFAELTGINIARGLGLLLRDDEAMTPIRCGVASFRVRNGQAAAQSIVIDTENMLIRGGGGINLRDETLNLRIEGEAKQPRLLSVAAPITVTGRLRAPRAGVEASGAIGQGGLAALLATVAAPLAAILPFVDPGLAEDANCARILAGRESARL